MDYNRKNKGKAKIVKVLYVTPLYEAAWAFGGGAIKAVGQLCRGLAKKGVDITVYTTDADGKGGYFDVPLQTALNVGGVKVCYFHCSFGAKDAFYSRSLAEHLDKTVKNFALVHVSAFWQFIQVSVSRACKKFNIPYVVSTHGCLMDWGLGRKRWKRFPYWYLFTRPTLLRANAIHYVSNGERVKSQKRFKNSIQSYIVPNCLNLEDYVLQTDKIADFRNSLRIPRDAFIVSFLSLIRPRKGLELLIKAFSHLGAENVFLLIGGAVESRKYLKSLKTIIQNYNLNSKVMWLGLIKPQELSSFYGASNLFVLPSFEEAFGMVVVEAMACGVPVLVSREVPIWQEIVQDQAGLTVNFSPEDIANNISKLVSNPHLLQSFSKNAGESVKNRYDIEKVASLMKKSYEDVTGGHRSPELQWQ